MTAFYGQNSKISVLTVIGDWILRANLKNQHFARNRGLHFTGKSQESVFCP
ncbi:vitamin B12-binding protein [Ligilactobacillus ruminis]|uniref:vitamin B12-binding protein n=1 Tax=Ligilactobacillus ruminis TaxID=1623 RepID=UPI003F9D0132